MLPLMLAALAFADDPEPASKEPPRILVAQIDGDKLTATVTVTEMVPVTVIKEVIVNGQKQQIPVTEYRTVAKIVKQQMSLDKATIATAGGTKLTLDDVKKRFEKPAPVVLSSDGKPVNESFLKLFDKDAVVLVIPHEAPKKVEK